MHLRIVSAFLVVLTAIAPAQAGNGGNGDLKTSPLSINANFTLTVTGGASQPYGVFISDAPAEIPVPGLGTIWIDVTSPLFGLPIIEGVLSPAGTASLSVFIPNDVAFLGFVVYLQGYVLDPGHPSGLAITRPIRIEFETPDSFVALPPMSAPRALGTGDSLPDGRVLVAGGGNGSLLGPVATNTTEIYRPYLRDWVAGPNLGLPRAFHASAVLNDGRVLICGGTNSAGTVTNTCDIFNPATNTITPAASMGSPRAAFAATTLGDGRVLVTGGTSNFVVGGTAMAPLLGPVLNAAQTNGEVYNPATNTWTPVANAMGSKRMMHTQTLMANGRVFCVAGINGFTTLLGQDLPTFTATTSIYDPVTNLFSSGASIPTARAGHAATRMPNGEIFVSGGVFSSIATLFIPTATNDCRRANAIGSIWSAAGTTPVAVAFQGQVLLPHTGRCHLSGGGTGNLTAFSATAACGTRVEGGGSVTATASLPDARGFHLAVVLQDGSVLISGGGDSLGAAVGTNLLYTPAP